VYKLSFLLTARETLEQALIIFISVHYSVAQLHADCHLTSGDAKDTPIRRIFAPFI
jgi:hypothetical protein